MKFLSDEDINVLELMILNEIGNFIISYNNTDFNHVDFLIGLLNKLQIFRGEL